MYILHVFVLYLFSKTNLNNCVPSSKWNVYNDYKNDMWCWWYEKDVISVLKAIAHTEGLWWSDQRWDVDVKHGVTFMKSILSYIQALMPNVFICIFLH